MKDKISCAVVGLGRIGSTLEKDTLREKPATHAGAIDANPRTVLVAGADSDSDARSEFVSDWNVAVYESLKEMLEKESPDILHIATWTENHVEALQTAIDAAIPVVVCEKPLAEDMPSLANLMAGIPSTDTRVVMNHERRFSADYRKVREIIDSSELGDLHRISSRLYMGKTRPIEKIIYHDGTHMLDILRFLLDGEMDISRVTGDAKAEGGMLDILATSGERWINMEIAGGRDHLVFEFDLSFSEGRIRIGNGVFEVWDSSESPFYTGFRSLVKTHDGWEGSTGYFSGMMDHAVDLLENPDKTNESSIFDGYSVMRLIEEILEAAEA